MNVSVFLADYVAASEGKLNAIGIGWERNFGEAPFGLGVVLSVPWTETNKKHSLTIDLVDEDGNALLVPQSDGSFAPLQINTDFEIGRPAGAPSGMSFSVPMALNLSPLPLLRPRRYTFRIFVDGTTNTDWHRSFTADLPPQQVQG